MKRERERELQVWILSLQYSTEWSSVFTEQTESCLHLKWEEKQKEWETFISAFQTEIFNFIRQRKKFTRSLIHASGWKELLLPLSLPILSFTKKRFLVSRFVCSLDWRIFIEWTFSLLQPTHIEYWIVLCVSPTFSAEKGGEGQPDLHTYHF